MFENFLDLSNGVNTFAASSENPLGLPILGQEDADRISGLANPDLTFGNAGSDIISGLEGADTLHGGRGGDLLSGNQGADQLLGQRGNDVISGGLGDDELLGGEGDDFLAGDAGTDTLTGGDGSDAFVLDIRHSTTDRALADVISDFSKDGEDVFALTDGANDDITEADLNLETVDSDTFISLKSTGAFLARVQGVSAEEITGNFTTVRATLDDTEVGATILSPIPGQASVQGQVGDEDYGDWFQFQVTQTSIVDLSLTGLSADADLTLYQDLDEDGEFGEDEIISQSVRSGNADETIENVTLNPGNYFLSVEQYEGGTNYNLNVTGVAGTVARDLAGSDASTARTLVADGEAELHDNVGGSDAVDTYRLVVDEGYLDVLTNVKEASLNVSLWSDRNGNNQLDTDEIVAQGTDGIRLDFIDPGTYYVNVTAPGTPTSYEIRAINSPGSRVEIESYNSLDPGLPITGTLSQKDNSDPNDPDNYADPYLVPTNLGAGSTVTVTQESKDFDAYLRVVDLITGEVVAENNDIDTAGGNSDAQVSFTTKQEGKYVVYASSVDAPGVGDYTLNTSVKEPMEKVALMSNSESSNVQSRATSSSSSGSPKPEPNKVKVYPDPNSDTSVSIDLVYQTLPGTIDKMPISAMAQGSIGDCYVLAALTATFGKIEIEKVKEADNKVSDVLKGAITPQDKDGNYTITFSGVGRKLTVDQQVLTYPKDYQYQGKTIPLRAPDMIYGAAWTKYVKPTQASTNTPIWASLFERAYAQYIGSYDELPSGDPIEALESIMPGKSEKVSWNPEQPTENSKNYTVNQIFESIGKTLDAGGYVVTSTINGDYKGLYNGVLIPSHAYSVHDVYDDPTYGKMILVRNPWGLDAQYRNNKEGKWAIPKAEEDRSTNLKDGFIAIKFDAFLKNFGRLGLMPKQP